MKIDKNRLSRKLQNFTVPIIHSNLCLHVFVTFETVYNEICSSFSQVTFEANYDAKQVRLLIRSQAYRRHW